MNEGDDDDDDDDAENFGNGKASFDSDDDDDLLDITGIKETMPQASDSIDMFDTLKSEDDITPKKTAPTKRKLGNKPEVVKPPSKRTKKAAVSDSEGASPVKVTFHYIVMM